LNSIQIKDFVLKRKEWLKYVIFALVLTLVLLYYRFPSDAARDYFRAKGLRANPSLALSVDRIVPAIPIGLKFVKTKVAIEDMPDRVILRADRLLIRPKLFSLLLGKSKFSFKCLAYQGDVRGSVGFKEDQKIAFVDTEMAFRNIRVGDYPLLANLLGRPLKGTLDGTISYSGQYNPMLDGSGEAKLRLSEGSLKLLQPFLTLQSIDFDEMDMEVVLKQQEINVTRLELKGKQLQGALSGTITMKEQLEQSSLDLKGTIEPFAALFKSDAGTQDTVAFFKERLDKGPLSFVIRGTMKDPLIEFT
jgi:type II secretion system protein N